MQQYSTLIMVMVSYLLLFSSERAQSKPLTLKEFKKYALNGINRCTKAIKTQKCERFLSTALKQNLITKPTFDWGKKTAHYPVVVEGEVMAVCKCGCLAKGTMIQTIDDKIPIEKISLDHQVKFLTSISENKALNFDYHQPKATVFDMSPTGPLIRIYLEDHQSLVVTQNHGMLTSKGKMKYAKDLKVGEYLLHQYGDAIKIQKVEKLKNKIPVYNIEVNSEQYEQKFIVANGIVVGDLSWQNQNEYLLHQMNLRLKQP